MDVKKALRKKMKGKRAFLNELDKLNKDNIIKDKFLSSDFYKNSIGIFIYVSLQKEVDTHSIIKQALKDEKRVFVPKVISLNQGMVAVEIKDFSCLKQCGTYKILEPVDFNKKINKEDIDLAVVPGIAFDRKGGRLGYGGGFYDRFFVGLNKNVPKIALAYDFQIVDDVPKNNHDICVHKIITD
ncbi:5-formyltetrahydrofolate cyclo-ligase [Clostridium niameyense]|uniref:5-formyltetrahydrofolate cyclo-ligase n=1 Tax=Clostridium niameyense TaxID=1622073 RepID=UPI00067EB107|nr:5-formyltetrahydrofolate cyclo-ligase [Clostridium niameyense]